MSSGVDDEEELPGLMEAVDDVLEDVEMAAGLLLKLALAGEEVEEGCRRLQSPRTQQVLAHMRLLR